MNSEIHSSCVTTELSGRTCELGTYGCYVRHTTRPAELLAPQPQPSALVQAGRKVASAIQAVLGVCLVIVVFAGILAFQAVGWIVTKLKFKSY